MLPLFGEQSHLKCNAQSSDKAAVEVHSVGSQYIGTQPAQERAQKVVIECLIELGAEFRVHYQIKVHTSKIEGAIPKYIQRQEIYPHNKSLW